MTTEFKVKWLCKSFILLGAVTILLGVHRATAQVATEGTAKTKITLPALDTTDGNSAVKEPAAASNTANTRLVIKLKDRRVYLYRHDQLQTSYPIAIGKKGWETPKGNFKVIQMLRNPSWQHPWNGTIIPAGADNPLGLRWIGFWTDGKNFIGFHGTPNESLIGQAVSHGCVRMRNQDIVSLFAQVNMGTPVIVEP